MTEKALPYDEKRAISLLKTVTTATLTTILIKKGLRNVWMRNAGPLKSGQTRVVGRAFTMRFIPAREDLANPDSWSSPTSTRAAIEAMPEGVIAVFDAMGVRDAGILGDILCARMAKRNVAGLVSDGVVRDAAGIIETGLPVWCAGVAASPAIASLTFVSWQEPIACGGVAIFPDDLIVADDDGAVVIPAKLVDEVVDLGIEQERFEGWILREVNAGHALTGLYPANAENKARYEAWREEHIGKGDGASR
ncbi:ribonuclease activity regulator RraA [uncultured Cohaesibacter sp.]|uniref:ribonuclease activity regulator RraA n=1 Tax=uncultured Cohaesibacter sp. TaxID=1002546 RepID=UPI0029C673C6|nr:ribonuclease activity regulator RraA [uncultured Cohaesibacter sp.]